MNNRIADFAFCMLITTLVVVVIYSIGDASKKATSVLHYIPQTYLRQYLSTSANNITCVTGQPCIYSDVVDLRVVVLTFNRADSLSKLLHSLDTLVLDENRAALEIWIDRDRKNTVDQQTVEVTSTFKWTKGPTRVHMQVGPIFVIFIIVLLAIEII